MSDLPTFELTLPGKDTPGFLRRQHKATMFIRKLKTIKEDPDETVVVDMIGFLLPFITKPKDREEATEIMWDMSEVQFTQLMEGVAGLSEEQEEESVPPPKSGS